MVLSGLKATTELLCMHCSLIGPHLAATGMSHDFSLFALRSRVIFSPDIRMAVQKSCCFRDIRSPV